MSAILLEGQIVHYEVLGRGRPIIFLHGWLGSWRYWIASMQVASTSFRAYALDLWGFGDTAHDMQHYGLPQQAELLRHFLDEMGIGKVALVGHGLGALVGLNFCSRWPELVDRMMAVNCPASPQAIHPRLRSSSLTDLLNWLKGKTPEAETALSDAVKADPRAVLASVDTFQANGLFAQMHQSAISCLLVYGQNDTLITPISSSEALHLPYMMHQIVLENCGHFPMIDDAARFNRLLIDFLALESGITPQELQLKEEWKRRVR